MEWWSNGVMERRASRQSLRTATRSERSRESLCFVAPNGVAVLMGLPVRAWMCRLVLHGESGSCDWQLAVCDLGPEGRGKGASRQTRGTERSGICRLGFMAN